MPQGQSSADCPLRPYPCRRGPGRAVHPRLEPVLRVGVARRRARTGGDGLGRQPQAGSRDSSTRRRRRRPLARQAAVKGLLRGRRRTRPGRRYLAAEQQTAPHPRQALGPLRHRPEPRMEPERQEQAGLFLPSRHPVAQSETLDVVFGEVVPV